MVVGRTIWAATQEGELNLGGGPQPYDNSELNRNLVVVGVGLDGAFRWGRHYGSSAAELPPNVAANESGHVFTAGRFTEPMTVDDFDIEPAGTANQYVFRFAAE